MAALLAVAVLVGCAGRVPPPAGAPVADPAAVAQHIAAATLPASPRQVTFSWTLNEAGSKLHGRGVARFVAPDHARLDLFGPRGESYLAAALVDGEFRLPQGASARAPLPSPALLWAAVGVVQTPADAALEGATSDDSVTVLRYRTPGGEEFRYRIHAGPEPRLEQLERIGGSGVLETVWLDRDPRGRLQRTRYRDWSAYRDLTLDVESINNVESFPGSIWRP
ncbi:MAG TPA: hypothetical protein VFL93_08340 [Longimicrobiaceae bacterium]|nr:hypothetical protein [Longimicrobiaceae bacterium]